MRRHALGLVFFTFTALGSLGIASAQKPATTPAGKDGGAATATSATSASSAASASSASPTSSTTPAAAGSGPAVPIPDKPAMDGATYSVRLRDLEARVDELKDQIRRSHTRLALLSDTILSGGAAGSRAEVTF